MTTMIASGPLATVLSRLEGVRRAGAGFTARCPVHSDQRASLTVAQGADGRVLVRCHAAAGCSAVAIAARIGLRMSDLYVAPARTSKPAKSRPPAPRPTRTTAPSPAPSSAGYQSATVALEAVSARFGKPTSTWQYQDEFGFVDGLIVRWDAGDGTKTIRPVSRGADGRWRLAGMVPARPLFGLPELLKTHPSERIFVVEGEKVVDAARSIGLTATTSSHGASSAAQTDWRPLAGREVVVMPDADAAGERYAADVQAILAALTPAASVTIVRLPGLPAHGDLADWLDAHGDSCEPSSMVAEIESLIAAAKGQHKQG